MKTVFSTTWKSSSQTRKQRKFQYNAPKHIQSKFLSASLSPELVKKHNTKSLRIRTGDKVKVLRGQFKGVLGAVEKVDLHKSTVYVQKAEVVKKDGSKSKYPIHASNVMIVDMKSDKKRVKGDK